jgi:hypothetical protein
MSNFVILVLGTIALTGAFPGIFEDPSGNFIFMYCMATFYACVIDTRNFFRGL